MVGETANASHTDIRTLPLHALCNAHHLRELKVLVELEKEFWAARMQRLLRRACHAVNLAREQDVPLKPNLIALIERQYDAIVAASLTFHEVQPAPAKAKPRGRPPRRVGHNLLPRLSTHRQDVLRFLTDPRVPFTNNRAEPDGRMMKCGRRSRAACVPRTASRTSPSSDRSSPLAGSRGWIILATLIADPDSSISQLRLS
ncbi:MAG TPA: transposase [Magnetospirillaceae bacterium]|jgi:transposase